MAFAAPDNTRKPETLAFRDVEPGSYWADFGPSAPWYVKSAQCGDVDLLREKLTVAATAPCSSIEIVLRNDGATLKVSAEMEKGATAQVLLMPERAPREATVFQLAADGSDRRYADAGAFESSIAGGEGTNGNSSVANTEFANLAPGDYRVLLLDRADELEYTSPDAIADYISKASHVTLEAGQTTSINLELVRVKR
jgi:hypothetical protein